MSDIKRGSFADVMEGIDEEIDAAAEAEDVAVEEPTEEGVAEETTEEVEDDEEEEGEEEEESPAGEEEPADEAPDDEGGDKEEDDEPLTFTVKIDGTEQEIEEEELLRGYQTAQSSTKRFTDAKKLHTEAQSFFKTFLESPGQALTDFLVKQHKGNRVSARTEVRDKFLEFLAPDLEESLIEDEKERELHKARREIAEERAELDRQKNEATGRQEREAEQEFIADLRVSIDKNIKKFRLPEGDLIVNKAADILEAAQSSGSTNDEILALVPAVMKSIKEERLAAAKELAKTISDEELEEMYPEQMKALKKKRLERIKKKKQGKTVKKDPDAEIPKPKKRERKKREVYNSNDVFNSIDLSEFDD